jgi:outer membrane lipoprotein-sorting protein
LALVGTVLPVEDTSMNPSRLFLVVVAGCCLLHPAPLAAQQAALPFTMDKQYSADMVITTAAGQTITQKVYSDSGKIRTEMNMHDMQMVMIVRPDLQKVYQVMVAQKMVMEMPYDPNKFKSQMAAASGPQGKFELIGPDTVEGVACTKYKVTSDKDNKVFFIWVGVAAKAPVKMMAEDNSITILWKNYKAAPQDAALFEPPADYQKMTMPAMPGGAGGAGQ